MEIVSFVALFVLGVLCAANLIIAKKPDAQELIARISPYQGWIGALCAVWGAWWTVRWVLNVGLLSKAPVAMITWLANALLLLGLGILCGIAVLKTFIKAPAAREKLDRSVAKLAPFQGILGLASMGVAVWTILELYILRL